MVTLFFIYIFIVGVLIGSFVNVVALRFNTGLSFAWGRSVCFSCGMPLRWFDLIPFFSFLWLRGKCRKCKSRISWQYPLIELISGFLFLGIALRQYGLWSIYSSFPHGLLYSILFFLFYAFVFSLLLAICVYDIKHTIIPDEMVYTFIVLSVLKLILFFYFVGFSFTLGNMLDLAAPFILSIPFGLMWFFSDGAWIGFGDVKLMFGIGALLGLVLGLSAVVLGFWIGAVWGVASIALQQYKQKHTHARTHGHLLRMSSEIPFAPFLIAGTVVAFLYHIDVFSISHFINLIR